jgi:hypothetical protein
MSIHDRRISLLAAATLVVLVPLMVSGQQRVGPSEVAPALFGPTRQVPAPVPATEATVKLRASVTFRDDATAGIMDDVATAAERTMGFDLLPGLSRSRLVRGSSNTSSESRPFAKTAWDTARIGERVRLYAVLKSGSGDPCSVETGLGTGPIGDAWAVWQLDARVAAATRGSVGSDVVTLDLTWSRVDRVGNAARLSEPERRTMMLESGERHIIDFFAAPRDVSTRCANLVLDVSASVPDPSGIEGARLGWDVWLVHKDRTGREWSQHQYAAVASRSPLTTLFDPLEWTLSGEMVSDGRSGAPLRLEAVTTVRGWVRPDGKVGVALRYYWLVGTWPSAADRKGENGDRSGSPPRGEGGSPRPLRAVTSGGMRMLQMENGQTVSFVVSLPDQDLSLDTPTSGIGSSLAPGVAVSGRTTTVDLEKFFAGTETSVIVTLKRR